MLNRINDLSHKTLGGLLILLCLWTALPGLSSLPAIDRDEARYAQAVIQMTETEDYINIRFQDRARNKKPAGIYWLQAGFVNAFTDPGERAIWAHRIPSVLGLILAVLSTYLAGLAFLPRRAAFIAAALMAVSVLPVFEAHIAKTDAALLGFCTLGLACLMHLRNGDHPRMAVIFWIAMGCALMIKGPILPALVILTLIGLFVWERDGTLAKRLVSPLGIIVCLLIVLPWSVMIWQATDGAFFSEAIGGDLAPKLAGGQEKHGAPPGYYTLTLPLLFWPASLFLIPALMMGVKHGRREQDSLSGFVRLLLLWAVPFWILLEIVPTKLPNYLLPIYPALSLLIALMLERLLTGEPRQTGSRISAGLFALVSVALIATVISARHLYAVLPAFLMAIGLIVIGLSLFAAWRFFQNRTAPALLSAFAAALIMMPVTYSFVLPKLETLFVSRKVEAALNTGNITLPRLGDTRVLSPHFTEPSLVYRLGTDILLGDKAEAALAAGLAPGDIILTDLERPAGKALYEQILNTPRNLCITEHTAVKGLNYSKGDDVTLSVLQAGPCG